MRRIAHLLLAAPALGWSPWRPQDAIKTMAHASAHSFERIVKKAGPPPPPRPPLAPETVIAAAVREEAGAPGVELANLHDHEPGWS